MAATVSEVSLPQVWGGVQVRIYEVAFDSSYPTGGESLTPAMFGLNTIDFLLAEPAGGYTFEYDHANSKLIARVGDNDAVADGPGVQVANATNLSTVTGVRVLVLGR